MRRLLVGIFLFSVLIPGVALAETKGEVQSLGFGWHYRPNCHVPMLLRVQADKSGTYQIHVVQEDMDRDQEIFVQPVSLTGADDGGGGGGGGEQRFWLYFIPQPTDGGLNGLSLRELQQQLKVFLCDEKGRQICQLPVTQTVISIDQMQAGAYSGGSRGTKLIVAVSDTAAQPVWRDYQYAIGTVEDVMFVTVRSAELPEDVRGYEGIDGLVWLNAPAPDSAKPAEEKRYHAIREYVRGGGNLVICQPPQREATAEWDDLMPVTVKEITPRATLEPLRGLARADERKQEEKLTVEEGELKGPGTNDWDMPRGPFMFARAELKPKAVADPDLMLVWDDAGTQRSPYLARIGYGAGSVSWVAHDLADPVIVTRAKSGWPFVWDRVLGFNDNIMLVDQRTTDEQKRPYAAAGHINLGSALLEGMELKAKSRALVAIAVVFFIAYWLVAGPGVYLWLVTQSRSHLSWFMFALSALVATALTVLLVKLIVRGPPELSHVTVIRATPGEPMIAMSQIGLYIPRDGSQELALLDVAPKNVSYITGFPLHPLSPQAEMDFPARMPYLVPLREANSDEPVDLSVPFRSTLKKFQARRVGAAGGMVDGSATLRPTDAGLVLDGIITNGTGQKLRNVYIAYHDTRLGEDMVFYQPTWDPQASIDLEKDFAIRSTKVASTAGDAGNFYGYPEERKPDARNADDRYRLRGRISSAGGELEWSRYWFSGLRASSGSPFAHADHNDLTQEVKRSFPMMSLFGRLPPMRNEKSTDRRRGDDGNRMELLRRGGRHLDVSGAVGAGRLVVLAESNGPAELPFALQVEGDKVAGKGTLFYQFILPLDHPADPNAATQPAPPPAKPADSAPVAQPRAAQPPAPRQTANAAFDPAAHVGGKGDLSNAQWIQVLQYRRQQAKSMADQKRLQRAGATPATRSS